MIDHTRLNDLRSHEFSKAFRGYAQGEVDELLEGLLFETGLLVDGVQKLETRVQEMETERDELRTKEEMLSATLVAARSTAEDWKTLARKEAEQLIREARSEADELMRQARQRWSEEEESRARVRYELLLKIARVRGEFSAMKEALDRWELVESDVASNLGVTEHED